MTTISELIEKQQELLKKCKKIEVKVDLFLKQKNLTEQERNLAEMTKQWVNGASRTIKNIGCSVPEFFVGDLLDMKNYYEYYDSFFYGPKTSHKERKKGNEHLAREVKKTMPEVCPLEEWITLSEEEKRNKQQQVAYDVIDKKSGDLPSTKKLCEYIQNESEILKSYEKIFDDMTREKR